MMSASPCAGGASKSMRRGTDENKLGFLGNILVNHPDAAICDSGGGVDLLCAVS